MSINLNDEATGLAVASHAPAPAIAIEHIADLATWDDLLARAPMPHLPQTFAYGAGKAATGWTVRRVAFRLSGRVIAVASVLERAVLGLRVVARVNRGPIFLDPAPSAEQQAQVFAALRRRWRGPLFVAPALLADPQSDRIMRAAGYLQRQRDGWLSGRIDLSRDETAIWAGFTSVFRNRVRAAEKAGAELRIAEDDATFEWMLDRHEENMRQKSFRAVGAQFLHPMRAVARENVTIFQLLDGGHPVAGMSVVRFGRHAEYHIGWFGPEGRRLNAGNFLMWNIIKEMKRRGVEVFDVGGMKLGDGYTRFKRTMNPVEFRLAGEWVSLL